MAIRKDREMGKGGVAAFVQKGISYCLVNIMKVQEVIAVKVWAGKDSLTIISL